MSFKARWNREKLGRKVRKGFRGYPVATIAYYGPDDTRASKIAVGLIEQEGVEPDVMERWFTPNTDACPECPFWAGRDRFSGKLLR